MPCIWWKNQNDIYEEEDDQKINLEEYTDLLNQFKLYFNQKEFDLLNNDIKNLLDYFYIRELIIENYINEINKNNTFKRHSNLRIADYFLRILFEENSSTCEMAKLINQFISEINETYFEKENWKDLSDVTYMNKIKDVFGKIELPKFLLRKGFRIRREIQKFIESINSNSNLTNDTDYDNDNDFDDRKSSPNENTAYTESLIKYLNIEDNKAEEEGNEYNIRDIIKQMENNQLLPFESNLSTVFAKIFFIFLKEIETDDKINEIIIKNENIIASCFQLDLCKTINDFKKIYVDVDSNKIKLEFSKLLSETNESEYLYYFILASYSFVINKMLSEPNNTYISFLLFLQNFISEENQIFKKIIEKVLNNLLLNENDSNIILKSSKICEKYHITKSYDLKDIKDIFNNINNCKLKDRFFEIIKEEEAYERGSNFFRLNIINTLKQWFSIKDSEEEDTIERYLKLIPYEENKYNEKTILILISGYLSSNSDHFDEWNQLINLYKKRFPNPIIYFLNWPSSDISLQKLIFHRRDFRKTRERAKYCGKLLALMMMSDKIFNGFKINLAAFSLGNHVLKNCLKELENFGRLDIINNIIFLAGATNITNSYKWENRLKSISGNIINCYSDVDLALILCQTITRKGTIGTKKLKIRNVKIKNYLISSFHLLYRINLDELGKMFLNDLKE